VNLVAQMIYPDNQQVFVGNVPHLVSDTELKEYFEQYGPVADLRINRKTSNNLPNFGFVSFETVEAVQNILSSLPLPKLHGKHRINVEEKKPREELVANRPRSGTRPMQGGPQGGPGGVKPFGRDSYSPRGGGRGGAYNNGGGRGGPPPHNGGGAYLGGGAPGRSYTGSCSSDNGPPPAGPQH
jgi:RNA recognition motif-containing protein